MEHADTIQVVVLQTFQTGVFSTYVTSQQSLSATISLPAAMLFFKVK